MNALEDEVQRLQNDMSDKEEVRSTEVPRRGQGGREGGRVLMRPMP